MDPSLGGKELKSISTIGDVIGEGITLGSGVTLGEGAVPGSIFFGIFTPLFQMSFLPDLIHVNFLPK